MPIWSLTATSSTSSGMSLISGVARLSNSHGRSSTSPVWSFTRLYSRLQQIQNLWPYHTMAMGVSGMASSMVNLNDPCEYSYKCNDRLRATHSWKHTEFFWFTQNMVAFFTLIADGTSSRENWCTVMEPSATQHA